MAAVTTTPPDFNAEPVGRWGEEKEFVVERERLVQYASATNDDLPVHVRGDLAPPVFAAVPAMQVCDPIAQRIIPDDEVRLGGLHGEQDFRFHRPIEPGMTLVSRAIGVGFRPVGAGVTITVRGETRTRAGELVVEQFVTVIMRKARTSRPVGGGAPARFVPPGTLDAPPLAVFERTFDPDTPPRYAQASGDFMPIHTDDEFARRAGLPGIINHGLCTLAFATRGLIRHTCDDDPTRLRRLAVRFSRIVQPSQTLTTRLWAAGDAGGTAGYAFESVVDGGAVALKNGFVEVSA
ncbi:MaoC/PaaZ C-terminal domain-containing protein [Frankia sp. QA3]|uniref:MaoC/PaaZ C-terminal domain-containing protein n=1 Tax=Frankia sp. QA3 TaxID=710111 RepID=UPI000269BF8D|nr:MaoC/PaaZ C-terminal domain-containing protein [Frankia sp. QA3]EIV92878.1 acyl dehydratase [Frankia sp. QA3]